MSQALHTVVAVTPSAANRSILVVDDELSILELLTDILSDEGYQVATAANGREALDYLYQNPPPCLILLDLMMPVMDGPQFRAEQQRDPALKSIPVLVMSAGVNRERLEAALDADEYMLTPFAIETLLEAVGRFCATPIAA